MRDLFERIHENKGPLGKWASQAEGYFVFPKLEGPISNRMKFKGKEEDLSEREMGVLRYLFSNGQRAVPREELLRHVWGIETKNIETRTVDMHIAHLRRKLSDEAQGILQTVRGKGYRLIKQA